LDALCVKSTWHNNSITMVMEPWEVIQFCEITPGVYDKQRFINAVTDMTSDQFSRFCREYLHLMCFYGTYKLMYFTDETDLADKYPDLLHKPEAIDFDQPVTFIRRL
jgi:hypothetical protein